MLGRLADVWGDLRRALLPPLGALPSRDRRASRGLRNGWRGPYPASVEWGPGGGGRQLTGGLIPAGPPQLSSGVTTAPPAGRGSWRLEGSAQQGRTGQARQALPPWGPGQCPVPARGTDRTRPPQDAARGRGRSQARVGGTAPAFTLADQKPLVAELWGPGPVIESLRPSVSPSGKRFPCSLPHRDSCRD